MNKKRDYKNTWIRTDVTQFVARIELIPSRSRVMPREPEDPKLNTERDFHEGAMAKRTEENNKGKQELEIFKSLYKGERKPASRVSLKRYQRSLEKHKSYSKKAKEEGLTLREYKKKYWGALDAVQRGLLDIAIQREETKNVTRLPPGDRSNAETEHASYLTGRQVSSSDEQIKRTRLTGASLLNVYRRVISSGGTEIRASIESGWDYKSDLGWFRQAVRKASEENALLEADHTAGNHEEQKNSESSELNQLSEDYMEKRRQIATGQYTHKVRDPRFRKVVFAAHGRKCQCCGISIPELIEAAHVRPVEADGNDHPSNGIPLCPTHHTAFDLHLFTIDPIDMEIVYAIGYDAQQLGVKIEHLNIRLSIEDLLYRRTLFSRKWSA